MLRISKNTPGIVSIKYIIKGQMEPADLDSFVIIPGVTNYDHIYSFRNYLCFDTNQSTISVEFRSEVDLEKYFIQLMREIKLNQITNVSVEAAKK
jgi:spermidine/putrescine-binding protein